MTDIATSRTEARQAGLKLYLGSPCYRQHRGVRYTSNARCTECDANRNQSSYNRIYYQRNAEITKARVKAWASANPKKVTAQTALKHARKLQATPLWANLQKIDMIYKTCPKGHEVDHIVPLQGKTVCGLHVHWNMRHLSKSDNCSKHNQLIQSLAVDKTAIGWKKREASIS